MTTRICFIRHGETGWNVEKRIQGQIDISLNASGHKQAQAMASNAAQHEFSAIYSSDLQRASDTANMLAQESGLNIIKLPQLRERHFGIFQGLTAAEGKMQFPAAHAHYQSRDPESSTAKPPADLCTPRAISTSPTVHLTGLALMNKVGIYKLGASNIILAKC